MTNQMPSPAGAQAPVQAVGAAQPVENPPKTSEKPPVVAHSQGIQVVALRAGFFGARRRKVGDKFLVPSLDKVGTWMQCFDSKAEAEAQKMHKARKQGGPK